MFDIKQTSVLNRRYFIPLCASSLHTRELLERAVTSVVLFSSPNTAVHSVKNAPKNNPWKG